MPGRILILDDNMTRRITLAARLSGAFYDILVASSEGEAHAIIDKARPGVILVADELVCQPAVAFIRALRADPEHRSTTIFVLTAPGGQNGRADLLMAGADEVLPRSEPDEVFRARLRSHERSRERVRTLQMGGDEGQMPGLSEAAPQFQGKIAVTLMIPDADQAEAWRAAIGPVEGLQFALAREAELALPHATERSGLVLLGVLPGAEHRAFRMLAKRSAPPDGDEGELLILAPEADSATVIAGYEAGAGAVMTGPFDPAEIRARLIRLRDRLIRRRGLHQALKDGLIAAVTDPLTGLHNRRYALPQLARLSAQALVAGQDLAVLVLDLDHFKQVNDAHGHGVGDLALRSMAQTLQDNLRPGDLIARIGGEEFLVALPQTELAAARKIAARLCRAVRETPVLLPGPQQRLRLTVSVGLAMAPPTDRAPEDLIAAADKALYAAKGRGRDQVALLGCRRKPTRRDFAERVGTTPPAAPPTGTQMRFLI